MKKGFTLIELLVVVLIIGILASVAIPQYTKTVEKSRAAEAFSMISSINNAVRIFYMEDPNATHPKLDELSIGVNGTRTDYETYSVIDTGNFKYRIGYGEGFAENSPVTTAMRSRNGVHLYSIITTPMNMASSCGNVCCWKNTEGSNICRSLGYIKAGPQTCSTTSLGCNYMGS